MGLQLEIDFSEIANISERFYGIRLRAQDMRAAAPGIRLIMVADVDERFLSAPSTTTGGTVYGGAYWVQLSEAYLTSNPRRLDGQILRDTGELLQSLTSEATPYHIFEVSERELIFGTALLKAGYLNQFRNFLFWHYELLLKVANYTLNYING